MKKLICTLVALFSLTAQAGIQFDVDAGQDLTIKFVSRDSCSSDLCYAFDTQGRHRFDIYTDGRAYRFVLIDGISVVEITANGGNSNGGVSREEIRQVVRYIQLLPQTASNSNEQCPVTISFDRTTLKIKKLQYKCQQM